MDPGPLPLAADVGSTPGAESALAAAVLEVFAPEGPLARADSGYCPRDGQMQMAAAIAQALEQRSALVVEAGTGVGKTFAYLVPVLLAGGRALISTATKSLQDQLFLRDLPRLTAQLGLTRHVALLKGRAAYLCRQRLAEARLTAALPDRWAVRTLARVEQWAQATTTGDLAEVEGLDDRSPVLPWITSTRDNCLGSECPEYAACHVVKARRDAMAADVVVVNHHLFFADLTLRDSGVSELLPSVDAVVFDEAHQLSDAGVGFLGEQWAMGATLDLLRDVLAHGLGPARGLQAWSDLVPAAENALRALRLAAAGGVQPQRGVIKLAWEERAGLDEFTGALRAMAQQWRPLLTALGETAATSPEAERLHLRAQAAAQTLALFETPIAAGRVRWIDLSPASFRLVDSPLDIRDLMTREQASGGRAWVFTSATLGDDAALSWFTRSAAQEAARTLRVPSPFDYAQQGRVWVPRSLPAPPDPRHPAAVAGLALRLAEALCGRCFVLTTTLRAAALIAERMEERIQDSGSSLRVLAQGSQPRRALLQAYGDGHERVLVGSASFWEGIDMPGEALQCVVIDKLPFPPPNDPLVQARVRALEAAGESAFDRLFLAEAAISLKQGAGRLIRTESDRGLLVIGDPRIVQKSYGKRLLRAVPAFAPIDSEADALAFLQELRAERNARAW